MRAEMHIVMDSVVNFEPGLQLEHTDRLLNIYVYRCVDRAQRKSRNRLNQIWITFYFSISAENRARLIILSAPRCHDLHYCSYIKALPINSRL